ncbi:BppU family phage baseplate upper protein [Bacillus cereus group sp. MYBK30-1]|uniref:BppU family phage baseplate upper protein n=1 Tax=unclassified Bacillus cereus group TaxID=2750818 RepID=UPI003F7A0265
MTFKTAEITVDLMENVNTKEINFSQGDRNSAKLLLNVTNRWAEVDLSGALSVMITFEKPDRTVILQKNGQPINAMKGKYQIVLDAQTLASAGTVIGQVIIKEAGGTELESRPFYFEVKRSLSIGGVTDSKNDLTIIQKAIEVGEKFKDVDFAPIIAAGELAKGAVKKTGDTMTGNLSLDRVGALPSIDVAFKKDGATLLSLGLNNSDKLRLYDSVNNSTAFEYNPATKSFDVLQNTNLVKKSGDTITGSLTLGNELRLDGASSVQQILFKGDGTTTKTVWLAKSQEGVVVVSETAPGSGSRDWANAVYVGGSQNGLIKKNGDNMRGELKFDSDSSGQVTFTQDATKNTAGGLMYYDKGDSTLKGGIGRFRNPTGESFYLGWGANPWSSASNLTVSDSLFTYKGNKVAIKDKDGRANLTLTSDATNFDVSRPPVADRRGDTVTIRAAISLNANAVANIVTTLPVDMRPPGNLTTTILTNDGVATTLEVYTDGRITLSNASKGKNVYIAFTYVV